MNVLRVVTWTSDQGIGEGEWSQLREALAM